MIDMIFKIGDKKFELKKIHDPEHTEHIWEFLYDGARVLATQESAMEFMVDSINSVNDMYVKSVERELEEIQAREMAERELDLVFEQVGEMVN